MKVNTKRALGIQLKEMEAKDEELLEQIAQEEDIGKCMDLIKERGLLKARIDAKTILYKDELGKYQHKIGMTRTPKGLNI
jgi:hypothetical protein